MTVTYLDSEGATQQLEVDYVMVATGHKPATRGSGAWRTPASKPLTAAQLLWMSTCEHRAEYFALGDA